MSMEPILEELEAMATSIADQSQSPFQRDRENSVKSLLERGLDSLDFVDYLLAIEEKFGCRVSEEDIKTHELVSTAKMAAFLNQIVKKVNR